MKKIWALIMVFAMVMCIGMTTEAERSPDPTEKEPSVTAVVATKSSPLSLRATPNQNGSVICEIPKGEIVSVLEKGDWSKVEYNGKLGFVKGKYLKFEATPVSAMDAQDIVGLWTTQLNGSTVTLEINADGTCELTIGLVSKATWTLDGQTLTLTKDSVPLYGTYDGKTITLDYNGKPLTLTRSNVGIETESATSANDAQSIIGTWSVPTKSGKLTIKFNANGTSTLDGGRTSVTWELNGQKLTLKNSNGQILNGTYDGKAVTLEINGSQIRFTR